MHWISEENYDTVMKNEVEPFVAARKSVGFDVRVKGEPIYYEHFRADHPKGVIVISHGFTESVQKFTESIYYMLQMGYDVWGLDHRGHGFSFRENDNPFVVHADRFRNYVLDLRHLTRRLVRPEAGKLPVYLYCHSMGGCIGAWIIEKYPALFDRAVLSSPMLGLSFGRIPVPVMYAGAAIKSMRGKRAEPLSPVTEFEAENFEKSCDSSEARYHYYYQKRLENPKLQTRSPSIGWGMEAVKACSRVTSGFWTCAARQGMTRS